jgi:hypothetical protein
LVEAASALETVDLEGMLPEEAGRFAGDPNDTVFRQIVINRPNKQAPSGVTLLEDFFVGPTAEAFEFTEPRQRPKAKNGSLAGGTGNVPPAGPRRLTQGRNCKVPKDGRRRRRTTLS